MPGVPPQNQNCSGKGLDGDYLVVIDSGPFSDKWYDLLGGTTTITSDR